MTNEPTEETSSLLPAEINSQGLAPAHFYHRDPGYRPWLRPPGPRKPTPYEEILAMMARHVRLAVIACRIVFVFALVIVFDFMLPKAQHEAKLLRYNLSASGTYQMVLNDGSLINISKKTMRKLKGKLITVSRTIFFNVPYRLFDKENNSAPVEISIYGNFIFGPLALLLTSLVGVLHRKGVELRFNLGVTSVVLAMLNIVFMHVHKF